MKERLLKETEGLTDEELKELIKNLETIFAGKVNIVNPERIGPAMDEYYKVILS